MDALSNEAASKARRGLPAELAAKLVVKQALKISGLKDDTTCVVVVIIPSEHLHHRNCFQRKIRT
ncbi:hypothetical protein ACP4OV_031099 [Aristida adscensionis]